MRYFIDMDGTIARFFADPSFLSRMSEPGYFAGLAPYENVVMAVNEHLIAKGEDVYIISSIHSEWYRQTCWEKNGWLDSYLGTPGQKAFWRLFPSVGVSKSDYAAAITGIPITKDDVLLDDYTVNLLEWEKAGGSGIKLMNEVNGRGLRGPVWHGPYVSCEAWPEQIAAEMRRAVRS